MLLSFAESLDPKKEEREVVEGIVILPNELRIRTKERELIPFEPNAVQSEYLKLIFKGAIEGQLPEVNGLREFILKARQFGFSTLWLLIFFIDTITRKNTYSVVVAHDADSTERLFQTVQTFYRHLPAHKKPITRFANRREYVWPELNSTFFVGQAGSKDFGRSTTINNLLATEVAFWPDPERLFPALLGAVPASGNAVIESTANGFGTWHQKEYQKAKEGKSTFTSRFYAWFEHAEYKATPAPNFDRVTAELSPEERKEEQLLVERYGVTRAQLQWRRNKLMEPGMTLKFAQEYPANDEEAFQNSGRTAFRGGWVLKQAAHSSEEIPVGLIPLSVRNVFGMELDNLSVYRSPIAGRQYVIGGDVAEGLAHADYNTLVVLDKETLEEMASYRGHCEPDTLGVYADVLGKWFNTARIGIERNNHGFTTLVKLRDLKASNVYVHEDDKRGWHTNLKTKPQIIDRLGIGLRDELIIVRNPIARAEMRSYAVLPDGSFGAPSGEHDDFVMAWAIAIEIARRWTVMHLSGASIRKNRSKVSRR